MDGFDLNKIPKTHFVYEFKGPGGIIPLGYTKYSFGINMQYKLKNKDDDDFTGYYPSVTEPNQYFYNRTAEFSNYVVTQTKNTKFSLLADIIQDIKEDDLYLVVLENLNVNNMFSYYSDETIQFDDLFSPNLLKCIKYNNNFKIVMIDTGEGAYPHNIKLFEKINNFLERNNILSTNKFFIATNNNLIVDIKKHKYWKKYKRKINVFPINSLVTTAGKFISELRVKNNKIWENGYTHSIQETIHYNEREKYFLMYNRNSERMHRPYFVNELYKKDLLKKGFVSFLENPWFEDFILNKSEFNQLSLDTSDILDIKNNYKNYYPLVIENSNPDEVSNYHNFLSRKDEYEKSYFTIVSETNAESQYLFLTEKTIKPIMNLHPFVVLGNPNTLKVLKNYGFKTFDKWWDESYDSDIEFKIRAKKVLNIVDYLCNKTHDEWATMLKEMEETLIYNKNILHKLHTKKVLIKEFFSAILEEKTLL